MYLDIRFYLKCLPFFICSEAATGDALWKWVFSGVLRDSRGNYCVRVYFLIKFLASDVGVYSCGFCGIFGSAFFTEHLWMTASVCFICDILQIYKLRKNILLDKVFLIFYFRVGLVKLIKSNKKIYYLKKKSFSAVFSVVFF